MKQKLRDFHADTVFEIDSYQKPFRRDRKENGGGGILIYAQNGVLTLKMSI